jgi:hypothetical protein
LFCPFCQEAQIRFVPVAVGLPARGPIKKRSRRRLKSELELEIDRKLVRTALC